MLTTADLVRLSAMRWLSLSSSVVLSLAVAGWLSQIVGLSNGADTSHLASLWLSLVAAWPLRAVWIWAACKLDASHA